MTKASEGPPGSSLPLRLQDILGDAYRIEDELGGGGMARVFVAHEVAFDRRVVIKVLPPEMATGVNADRFRREIQLAAQLLHPLVVPVLTAGASGDLLYYVMPLIRGESLRARLERDGEISIPETVTLLRDVAEALAYAHGEGVVHRDIKPDNVLVSGEHALVTDFGVATAVTAATGEARLTLAGMAVGTPSYMAPEQVAGEAALDHRADIYALGVLAYEMLTGNPPFSGRTAQAVLGAQISEVPLPVSTHRGSVPPVLEELVMRCLAKEPGERFQSAEEVRAELDAVAAAFSGARRTFRRSNPYRVAALFGLTATAVLGVVYGVMILAGLPDWVFAGAVLLLTLGLPVVLLTGRLERRWAASRGLGRHTPPSGLARMFSWPRAFLGGGLGFVVLAVLASGFMTLRALGVAPFATLLTAGDLEVHDPIILSDFRNVTEDAGLGETVTELLRMDLARSGVISLIDPAQVGEVLQRMERDRGTPLTPDLVREMAVRQGMKAYIEGEVRQVGARLVLSARLAASASGESLASVREVASDPDDLIRAVDRLGYQLRQRIGESLRDLRAEARLADVTTSSLEALRLYSRAQRFWTEERDAERTVALLEEAVRIDPTFGAAYGSLAIFLRVRQGPEAEDRSREALERAFELRHRMSDRERYRVEALYASRIEGDLEKALTATLALVERYPRDVDALGSVAALYWALGRPAEAEAAHWRAIETGLAGVGTHVSFLWDLLAMGKVSAADSVLRLMTESFPDQPRVPQWAANVAAARRDFGAVEEHARTLLAGPPGFHGTAHFHLGRVAGLHGRFGEAARHFRAGNLISGAGEEVAGLWADYVTMLFMVRFAEDPHVLGAEVEALWRRNQELQTPPTDRPMFVYLLAATGRPEVARQALEERRLADPPATSNPWELLENERLESELRIAEGRPLEAVRILRESCEPISSRFAICDAMPPLAEAYDRAGMADSAIVAYERYVRLEAWDMDRFDALHYAPAQRRLAELLEARGDSAAAAEYYARFIELWRDADPDLQPQVQRARGRLAALAPNHPDAR